MSTQDNKIAATSIGSQSIENTTSCDVHVPEILIQPGDVTFGLEQVFTFQPEPLQKRHSAALLTNVELSTIYSTLSTNMINPRVIADQVPDDDAPNDENKPVEMEKHKHNKQNKVVVKSVDKIIAERIKEKETKDILRQIEQMKVHASQLLTGDIPNIPTIEGILRYYDAKMSNKIIKFVVLRSLVSRYVSKGENELIGIIFEFNLMFNDMKADWVIVQNADVQKSETQLETSTKINHRKARLQVAKEQGRVSDFEFPTVDELKSEVYSERIKIAIMNVVSEATKILNGKQINSTLYQMTKKYDRLPPFSNWDKKVLRIDAWQKEVIQRIRKRENILVCARTSAGKTICVQYCAMQNNVNKVLFVVPNSVLANQVAGTFVSNGIAVWHVTNDEEYGNSETCKVIVATPEKAEEIMCNIRYKIDYAVFDEIHQIDDEEGESIERLIKIVDCPFLVLSATIANPRKFADALERATESKVHVIEYNKRFIIQQKYVWTGKELKILHPMACIDIDYILNDKFQTGDLAMTARDLYELGTDMSIIYNIPECLPENTFAENMSITMDMIADYDTHLKEILIEKASSDLEATLKLLEKYKVSPQENWMPTSSSFIPELAKMLQTMKNNDLLPTLMFMMDDVEVLNVYRSLIVHLEQAEEYYFPWFRKLMEDLYKYIENYKINEPKLREDIANSIRSKGSKLKQINDNVNQQRRAVIEVFLERVETVYNFEKEKAANNKNLSDNEKELVCDFLTSHAIELRNSLQVAQINVNDVKLPEFNPYCPTGPFSFRKKPLSISTMRIIMHNLRKFFGQSVDEAVSKNMNWNNLFIRGIERGVIPASKLLPVPFLRITQEMISNSQIPVCICDDWFSLGVNFPTRTVVMLGNQNNESIPVLKAQQMSGRSGRRGFDTQGHIVYARVNFWEIMRGTYAPMHGKQTYTPFILLPAKVFNGIEESFIKKITRMPICTSTEGGEYSQQNIINDYAELYKEFDTLRTESLMAMLLWYFRDECKIAPNIFILIEQLVLIAGKAGTFATKTDVSSTKKAIQYDDDDDFSQVSQSGAIKHLYTFQAQKKYVDMIIELLFRTLDRADVEVETPSNALFDILCEGPQQKQELRLNKDEEFINMLTSDIWPEPLNMTNTTLINSLILNQIKTTSTESFNSIGFLISRLNKVINRTLKIYNHFASIGNIVIVGILDQALNQMIAYINRVRSLN